MDELCFSEHKIRIQKQQETGPPNTGSGIVSEKKLYQWQTKIRKNLKLESLDREIITNFNFLMLPTTLH